MFGIMKAGARRRRLEEERRNALPSPKATCDLCGDAMDADMLAAHRAWHVELVDGRMPQAEEANYRENAGIGRIASFLLRYDSNESESTVAMDRAADGMGRFIAKCLGLLLPGFPREATYQVVPLRMSYGKALSTVLLVVRY